jgi:cysteine desulfurase
MPKLQKLYFTSGGTEADNLVLRSAVCDLGVRHIISSKIEHHAVSHTIEALLNSSKVRVSYVKVLKDGSVCMQHLEELLSQSSEKTLVSLMHINNEIGTSFRPRIRCKFM